MKRIISSLCDLVQKTNAIGIHQYSEVKGLLWIVSLTLLGSQREKEVGTGETIALKTPLAIASRSFPGESK